LRKFNPNLKPPISIDGTSDRTCCDWDRGESDASGAKELVDRGLALDRQGRYDQALGLYMQALERRPHYARAFYDIGVVKDEQGKKEDAIAAYRQAIAFDESHVEPFENLGKVLTDMGRYVEAEDVLRRGLGLFSDSLDIMMNLGNALASQRKFEEAIPYFRKILDVAPDWGNARQSLCYSLLQLGRRDEAAKVRAECPHTGPIRIDGSPQPTFSFLTIGVKSLLHSKCLQKANGRRKLVLSPVNNSYDRNLHRA
jgi:Tfp pilus assembly protein PilF